VNAWLRQHGFALGHALRDSFRPKSGFLLNVLVIAIALALPFAGLTLLENVRPVSEQLAIEPEISLFLALDTPREQALALQPRIRALLPESARRTRLEFIPREKAFDALKEKTGLHDAQEVLGGNPLPDSYVLKLAGFRNADDAAQVEALAAKLKGLPGIELVQIDSAWVKRLAALLQVARLALGLLAAALGLVVIAVVFNTIRMQVMSQREEIEVSRLVGATDAFIRRPFYYAGALLGLLAGALALGAVGLGLQPLNLAVADLARLYGSAFRLAPLGWLPTAALLGLSALLGLAGSALALRRHLGQAR
jgi:cell division transport system permease protein